MKAIVYRRNGPPDVLSCEEIEKPTPNAQEVLIKVRAAAVNPLDCHLLKGGPAVMRTLPGRGKLRQPGVDVAGVVETVGSGVTEFTAGDAVFGACRGAFAEYAIAPVSALASKPETVSFEDAAASPIAALTALQGLRDKGKIQAGQHVLINGASGGVGTFGVQLAKIFGAHVTGVCSAHNAELVRSQARLDSARNSRWDGNPGRAEVPVVLLLALIWMIIRAWFSREKFVAFVANANRDDLALIGELLASGQLKSIIERRYRLSEVPEAMRYQGTWRVRGKLVICMDAE